MDSLAEYFKRLTNERSSRAIANRLGLDPSTVNRQLTGATAITVETVVAICRAYKLDLADAFVEAGFITRDEAESFADSHTLSRISDLELAHEIVRRLEAGEAGPALTDPISEGPADNVIDLRRPDVGRPGEDLREVAFETDVDHTKDTDDYDA